MSIQPVITYPRVSDAPASRRSAEGGEGEVFTLPEQQEGNAAGSEKNAGGASADKAVTAEAAAAAVASAQAEAVSAKANGKGEAAVKPGDVVAKPSAPPSAAPQPEAPAPAAGIDFLIAMAAAQAEAAAARDDKAVSTTDGKAPSTEGEKKPADAKTEDGAVEAASQPPGADQIKLAAEPPQPVAPPLLSLPAPAADSAGAAQSANAPAIAVGDAARSQPAVLPLPGFAKPGAGSAGASEASATDNATLSDGKALSGAGHPDKTSSADGTSPIGANAKAEGATVAAPAAADPKLLDSLQQALGPLDLSAMMHQAAGKPGHDRLVQPFDPGLAAAPAATPQPQGAGQPTPIHVVPIEIGLRAMAGSKQFDIRLDPDELGRVDVNLSISDKGEVSARLVVDRVETLHLLQRDARTLERAFEQAGLKPSDGGVDISLRDPSDQSFRQNRQHDEAPQRPRVPQGPERTDDANLSTDPIPQRRLVRLGGVDLSI